MCNLHKESKFPNGKRLSELYDLFLTHRDFACTKEEYEGDIADSRVEERQGVRNCRWRRDSDGQLVVCGLDLRDRGARVLITPEGFTVNIKPGKLVFISYAREDLDTATEIKDAIDRTGLNGWLDVRYLRGGLPWKSQIARMIQKSDFFVAVLSKLSVEKRGYVQREIREALETALSIPESRTFIVPVRLDECEPKHPALLNLSWIDLFPDRKVGIRRLIQSLHAPLDEQ